MRERAERASEMTLLVRLIGNIAGVDPKKLDKALGSYFDQLLHKSYQDRSSGDSVSEEERARLAQVEALNSGV